MAGGILGKLSDKAVKAFVANATPGKKLADGGGHNARQAGRSLSAFRRAP